MKQVAEGVKTAKVAKELAAKLGVDAPIIDAMHRDHPRGRARARGDRCGCSHGPRRIGTRLTMLGYVLDEIFVQHRAPSGHPERPARAEAVRDALRRRRHRASAARTSPIAGGDRRGARARPHRRGYLERARADRARQHRLARSRHLLLARHLERGARRRGRPTCELATGCSTAQLARGIAVVRPPGHHATRDRAMGFCMLNNVAVAAAAARARRARRASRSSTGTSTTATAPRTSSGTIRPCSTCRCTSIPYYPGTGAPTELGGAARARRDRQRRAARRARGDADYAAVFDHVFAPALAKFAPDLILVSAGLRRVRARSARRDARHPRRVRGDGAARCAPLAERLAGRPDRRGARGRLRSRRARAAA